jgi:hypothetical protein
MKTLRGVLAASVYSETHRARPRSARFRVGVKVDGRNDAGSSRTPLPSRSPDPHHLAVLTRPGFVRAAPILSGTTRNGLPSATPTCYDRQTVAVSHLHSNISASRRNHVT